MAENPLDVIERDHRFLEFACDALEQIAHSLPDKVDRILATGVITALRITLTRHTLDEENGLFPLLKKRALPDDNIGDIVAELALEHATDEGFAEEIIDELEILCRGERAKNAKSLEQMLRGFLEHLRRHMIWEDTVIMPLARRRLHFEDLQALGQVITENRERIQILSNI